MDAREQYKLRQRAARNIAQNVIDGAERVSEPLELWQFVALVIISIAVGILMGNLIAGIIP